MTAATARLPLDVEPRSIRNGPEEDVRDHEIVTITDLFSSKVRQTPNAIFLQYPETAKGKSDYVGYTVNDVDRLADEAARQYLRQGLHPEVRRSRDIGS